MKLSKATTYAVLALECLHQQAEGNLKPMRARQVAEHLGIPTDSALKVLQTLARGGMLKSTLGRRGGYRPRVPVEDVNLLQLVELMDGPIAAEVPVADCDDANASLLAQLDHACGEIRELNRQALGAITLNRLIAKADASVESAPPKVDTAPDRPLALAR